MHDSQQPTSYSSLSLKLPPPPCAAHTGSYVGLPESSGYVWLTVVDMCDIFAICDIQMFGTMWGPEDS